MGYRLITPIHSFVRFDNETPLNHCIWGVMGDDCLPVYEESDVAFQFVVEADTEAEADTLCQFAYPGAALGLVRDCDQPDFDVVFAEDPERYRLSDLQVLFNWPHGFPGMIGEYQIGECFRVRVEVGNLTECSNCFQRIANPCFTTVIQYSNDNDFAGFKYCGEGAIPGAGQTVCDPEIITFNNQSTLSIPYTTSMKDKYGDFPSVQVWIYDNNGDLVNMGITAVFDAYPPTQISFDFGGISSGIITIR